MSCSCKSPHPSLSARFFFYFGIFSSTSGCQFTCSTRQQQRQFKHLSVSIFISGKKKWYSTVWVDYFKFWSDPDDWQRATNRVRAHFTDRVNGKPEAPSNATACPVTLTRVAFQHACIIYSSALTV